MSGHDIDSQRGLFLRKPKPLGCKIFVGVARSKTLPKLDRKKRARNVLNLPAWRQFTVAREPTTGPGLDSSKWEGIINQKKNTYG